MGENWLFELTDPEKHVPNSLEHICPAHGCTWRLVELTDVDMIGPPSLSAQASETLDQLISQAVDESRSYRARVIEARLAVHVDGHAAEDWLRKINELMLELHEAHGEIERLRVLLP